MTSGRPLASVTELRPTLPRLSVPRVDRAMGNLGGAVGSLGGAVVRRWRGAYEVDEWGFDRELFDVASAVAGVMWDVSVGGTTHVPIDGPALLVANVRPFTAGPAVVTHAVHRATGRAVRFTGLPDIAPVGPFLRKLGGVLERPDEVGGLLRDGQLVVVWLTPVRRAERAGHARVELLAPSLTARTPVLPVAVLGHPLGRSWRVEIGPPVPQRERPGPLAEVELADQTRAAVQRLLDEASPPRWLLPG
jgi:hypothetical protein